MHRAAAGSQMATASVWEVVVFLVDGKENHCALAIHGVGLADNSLLGARVMDWSATGGPRGERLEYRLNVPKPELALEFLRRPGKLCEQIIAEERRSRGWNLTRDAPDFVRSLRHSRSVDPSNMNCVEWIVRALELGGVPVPLDILSPTDLRFWCVAGFPASDSTSCRVLEQDVRDSIDMMGVLREIAPLPRTLACRATDTALGVVAREIPEATIEGFATGSVAWSWTIPDRWEMRRATLRSRGKVVIDSGHSHLHCVNYSDSFSGSVSRAELMRHLHTNPDRPDAVPFVFSFYERNWGLCLQHSRLNELEGDEFEVDIDAVRESGELRVLTALLPGERDSEFIICANICHPCQANDSLTGLVVAMDVFRKLAELPQRKYSYRLLVVPETIGSIAYLSRHPEVMSRAVGALFSEMLGTPGPLVLQRTRGGASYWDLVARTAIADSGLPWKSVGFMKSACNDEKVLDSPGVGIPSFSLTRFPYPEYHTSDDNVSLVDIDRLREARDVLFRCLQLAELDYIPVLRVPGPVFLSGHGLIPDQSTPDGQALMRAFYDVMYAIDGHSSVNEIARVIGRREGEVRYWADSFVRCGLAEARPHFVERET